MLLLLAGPVLLASSAAAQALIVAVAPDLSVAGPGDEGFALAPTQGPVPLAGWSLTDGEGTWRLPSMVLEGETWFVGRREPWAQRDGPEPADTFGRALQLANDGDDLRLIDPQGREVDAFVYGGDLRHAGADMVWRRLRLGPEAGWIDTGSADDWRTPRVHRVGESDIDSAWRTVDAITAYASPDSSFAVLTDLMAGAERRLHLHVYELRSAALAEHLAAAARRGVDVQVLVEGRPVGQDAHERTQTAAALHRIEAAGGEAWLAQGGRYRFHHLKVLVADDAVAIQSENWVPSGVPADPSWGNRGWGVVLHGADVADWMASWMADDRGAWDAAPFDLGSYDPRFRPPPAFATPTGTYRGEVPPLLVEGPVRVLAVITPDATHDPRFDPTLAAAAAATHRLWAQQLDLSEGWQNPIGWRGSDGLREALRDAGRRGLDARVMAAAPFRLDDTGNAEAMAALPADGVATCTFWVPDLRLHNKGLIADDLVYVGSMNGNQHSRSMNREVGVLVDDPRVATYFAALFDSDWRHCGSGGHRDVPALGPMLFGTVLVVLVQRCCRLSRSSPS